MFGGLSVERLLLLGLFALFIFGPERLPVVAEQVAAGLRRLRTWLIGVQKELSAELGPEFGDLKLQELNPRYLVRKHLLDDSDSSDMATSGKPQTLALGEAPPWDPDAT